MANIQVSGKGKFLGSFTSAEAAFDAYKKAAVLHFGEFARYD